MIGVKDFLKASKGKASIFKGLSIQADKKITNKLTICIPDIHLLEKKSNDDFLNENQAYLDRFLSLLDFLYSLRKEQKDKLEIVQLGDMFDLWQAKWATNLILEAYPDIIGLIKEIQTVYVVGNHDIDLWKWYGKDEAYERKWRHHSIVNRKIRAIYEHGFQADFANNQSSFSGIIGREVTKIVGMMEYIYPDIDIILGSSWESIRKVFDKYNVFSPVRNPEGYDKHEHLNFYINQMEKYNNGNTHDLLGPEIVDLSLSVIAHTHDARLIRMPRNGREYYLLDCGSWVNGGHEFGVIAGKDIAVCQWSS
jgi:UDP-2,3-diacylglucosamine pyrophosphatase LpxH